MKRKLTLFIVTLCILQTASLFGQENLILSNHAVSKTPPLQEMSIGANQLDSLTFSTKKMVVDIWVTNTSDSGAGSLRYAINEANNSSGTKNIKFDISTSNKTIYLDSELPWITQSNVFIDGNSQSGIEPIKIDCSNAQLSGSYWILIASGDNIKIKGLWFENVQLPFTACVGVWGGTNVEISDNYFSNFNIAIRSGNNSNNIDITNNFVGITPINEYVGINEYGVSIENSSNVLMENNLITNVFDSPITVFDNSSDVTISSNLIGTEIDGSFGNGNIISDTTGVFIGSSSNIELDNNKISCSTSSGWGVHVRNSSDILLNDGNIIYGSYVGVGIDNSLNFTINESELICNIFPIYFQNQSNTTFSPIINSANNNQVIGNSHPNAVIEIYSWSITECVCQGESFIGQVTADQNGNWEFNYDLSDVDYVAALATINNLTSNYSDCIEVESNSDTPTDEVLCLNWVIDLFNNNLMDYFNDFFIFISYDLIIILHY